MRREPAVRVFLADQEVAAPRVLRRPQDAGIRRRRLLLARHGVVAAREPLPRELTGLRERPSQDEVVAEIDELPVGVLQLDADGGGIARLDGLNLSRLSARPPDRQADVADEPVGQPAMPVDVQPTSRTSASPAK